MDSLGYLHKSSVLLCNNIFHPLHYSYSESTPMKREVPLFIGKNIINVISVYSVVDITF